MIWRILCAVLTNVSASGAQWGSRGREFDSRHSDHKSNDFTLEIVGFFSFTGWPHLALTTILTTMRAVLSGQSQGQAGVLDATSSAPICEPALMPTL